jgi:dUTP pyrophosphatase
MDSLLILVPILIVIIALIGSVGGIWFLYRVYTFKDKSQIAPLVKFFKVDKTISGPTKSHDDDAGYDLYVREYTYNTNTQIIFKLNVKVEIPYGKVGLLFPRSSVRKTGLRMSNCVGVVDSGFRGEIEATFDTLRTDAIVYQRGDRAVQLIIVDLSTINIIEVTDENKLAKTDRGEGGHGSTGIA